jgi:RNA polymerase sigma-70 factor (ECF subfamily)
MPTAVEREAPERRARCTAGESQSGSVSAEAATSEPGTSTALASGTRDATRRELIALLPELRRFARFLVRQPSDSDDLVQETVVRALGALQQFVPGSDLRAWAFRILRNAFYEQARRRKSESHALAQSFVTDEAGDPAQDSQMAFADLQLHLFALTPLLREALVLVGAQGMTYEEAAAVCGVPEGTVKARVSRARRQLAEMMQHPVNTASE